MSKVFKREKPLLVKNISLAKMEVGDSRFFKAMSNTIVYNKDIDYKTGEQKIDKNGNDIIIPTLQVIDLEDDKETLGTIVIGFLIEKTLKEFAEKKELEGLKFELERGEKKGQTVDWSVYKIA